MADTKQRERIARVIEEYDAQGIHRTATAVDEASAEWLADEVRAIGLEPRLEGYATDRLDLGEAYIEVGGRRIEGVPLFDSHHTGPEGVTGHLGPLGGGGGIALIDGENRSTTVTVARHNASEAALVIATLGYSPGLSLLNAFDFADPVGPPSLQVSGEEREFLMAQAEAGAAATVVAEGTRTTATAYNVTAELAGTDPALPPLGVNTPRSGWWEIAAERGGGLACWLEVMRSVVASGSPRRVFFSANTGHELGFSGMDAVLDEHPELTERATWLHFGANIGAATGTVGRLFASTEELQTVAAAEFDQLSRPMEYRSGEPGGGEMASVHRRGGRSYLALTNDNAYFHMREDRYPDNVDVGVVAEFARASSAIAQALIAVD